MTFAEKKHIAKDIPKRKKFKVMSKSEQIYVFLAKIAIEMNSKDDYTF